MNYGNTISEIKFKLATALAAKRKELGITQIMFSHESGLDQGDISRIESGKVDGYSIETLLKANLRAKTGIRLFDALK